MWIQFYSRSPQRKPSVLQLLVRNVSNNSVGEMMLRCTWRRTDCVVARDLRGYVLELYVRKDHLRLFLTCILCQSLNFLVPVGLSMFASMQIIDCDSREFLYTVIDGSPINFLWPLGYHTRELGLHPFYPSVGLLACLEGKLFRL